MEISFLEGLAVLHSPILDKVMLFFTYLGEVGAVWIVLALVLLLPKKTRKGAIILAIALVVDALLINLVLKNMFERPRPFVQSEQLMNYLLSVGYKLPDDFSFPSGHSAVSFCAAAALVAVYGKKALPALFLAAVIAFSRLYLGVHYPTDVIAGAALGACIGLVTAQVGLHTARKIRKK